MGYKEIRPLPISEGGTNATTMATADGTVYYDGTRLVTTTTGTANQVLTSNGAGMAPTYQNVSASGAVTSVSGGNNITITGTATAPIVNVSGTTNHTVLLGNSTGSINSLTNGTTGQVLHAITGANDPTWSSVSLTADVSGVLPIANGGTNASSMATTDGTVYYDGTRLVTTATGTSGQALISNGAGMAPTYQNVSASIITGTTNHAVQVGNSTGGLNSISVGASNTLLQGNTGADPAFTGSPSVSGSFTAATNITATSGAMSAGTTVTAGTNLVSTAGNLLLPTTSSTVGQVQINSASFLHAYGTSNTFLGTGSGNFTLTGNANSAVGHNSQSALTSGSNNASNGSTALQSVTSGGQNSAFGNQALTALTTASFNTALGSQALTSLVSGNRNISIGYLSGTSYTGSEAHNIIIGNTGTVSESNTIRIGVTGSGGGQQNQCFIAGINGASITPVGYVAIDTNGKLAAETTTTHAVQVGKSDGTFNSIVVGTTGQLLVGSTSADPSFSSSSSGDFTFTSSTAGSTRTLTVSNTDNTNSSSSAKIVASVGGTSAGSPVYQSAVTGSTTWTWGCNNGSSQAFNLSQSATIGTNNVISAATGGTINYPLQSSFLAINGANVSNATGDGTNYTVICGSVIYDQNSNYNNSTGTFTAPVKGRYLFTGNILCQGFTSSYTITETFFSATSRLFRFGQNSPGKIFDTIGDAVIYNGSAIVDMNAGDTLTMTILIAGSTKTISILGDSTNAYTWLSGHLLA